MQNVPYEEYKQYLGPVRPCLICGDDPPGEKRKTWAVDEYFKAIQCPQCSLITVDPGIDPRGLELYYQDNMGRRLDQKKKMDDRRLQYSLDKTFLEHYRSSGKVLDVGCGGGFFLAVLDKGFEKYGIDTDAESIKYGKEYFGYDFRRELIVEDSFEKDFFDLIIFRGVIEHMYDPKKAIDRAYDLLKPNGQLFFSATPNADSFCADLYRGKWNLWHPIQHINLFSARTLHLLSNKERFNVVAVDYPYLGTPYENQPEDYKKLKKDIILFESGQGDSVDKSPPFWGNMMTMILQKK